MGFEPTFSAGERPQTYALDRVALGTAYIYTNSQKWTHMEGQIQKHTNNIPYNKDKLNYTINVLLIREVYCATEDIMELKISWGKSPLLALILHIHTHRRVQCSEKAMYLIHTVRT